MKKGRTRQSRLTNENNKMVQNETEKTNGERNILEICMGKIIIVLKSRFETNAVNLRIKRNRIETNAINISIQGEKILCGFFNWFMKSSFVADNWKNVVMILFD